MNVDAFCRKLQQPREDELDSVMLDLVELLQSSNPRCDWAGIYELHYDDQLRLGPFVGPATDHLFLGPGKDVAGSALSRDRDWIVPDVAAEADYRPLSRGSRSEIVVLIRGEERVLGQIVCTSREIDAFDLYYVQAVEKLAAELGAALTRRSASVHHPASQEG